MPLTFSLFLQLAVMQKLHMATMDVKSAYLNAALPPDADWIIATLEPHIAEVCGLDPSQEYQIYNALYGLPDSGRLFYLHYKAALLTEGYSISAFDNCLFYRTTATETTYIIVYVDDTFIVTSYTPQSNLHCAYIARSMHHTCSTPTARATLVIRYFSTEPPVHFTTAVLNKQRSLHRQHMPKQEPSSLLPKNSTSHYAKNYMYPVIIMEDNSAVVTMANSDSGYTKKCKHFLMVLNYIKEQIALGQIEARKIYGKLNNADMHTKPLRSSDFAHMAHKVLGHPAPPIVQIPPPSILPAEKMSVRDMDANSQPSNERKRLWLPDATTLSPGAQRRKEHLDRYVTRTASDSTMDAEVNVPAA